MQLVIVTGLAGAGKTLVLHALEDMGYYCIDNLPPTLMQTFVDLCREKREGKNDDLIAIGIDIRGRAFFEDIKVQLDILKTKNINYELLFMDASDAVLIQRFKETRRIHPLARQGSLQEGIMKERELLQELRESANHVIDTSNAAPQETKKRIKTLFSDGDKRGFPISFRSFGFKWGSPTDADVVMDVRFITNPFYVDELKHLTGKDQPVIDFVMGVPETQTFLVKFDDLLEFLVPQYIEEGKGQLVIGMGCTGGVHRSVALADRLQKTWAAKGYAVTVEHRDIGLAGRKT